MCGYDIDVTDYYSIFFYLSLIKSYVIDIYVSYDNEGIVS